MRTLIYTRVSSDPRALGRSVGEQRAECEAWAEREGWSIVGVVEDNDRSASRHAKRKRSGWEQVRSSLIAGEVDILLTWESSRAQRDVGAYAELRDLCTEHQVRWGYSGKLFDFENRDDRFRTGLDALLAEDEAERTRERVCRAMNANASKGRPHGKLAFGYRREYDPATRELIAQVPHPEQAPIVRELAERFLAGASLRTLAKDLEARGIPTPRGGAHGWRDSQVGRILRNPHYAARRVHRGEVVGPGDWEPLLDDDTFDRLAVRLNDPARKTSRAGAEPRLLTGVVRCGTCGAAAVMRKQGGKNRKPRRVYQCRENYCTSRDLPLLDAYVSEIVREALRSGDVAERMAVNAEAEAEAEAVLAELAALDGRLDEAAAAYAAGDLSASMLARVEADLSARRAKLKQPTRRASLPTSVASAIESPDVDDYWDSLTVEERREILRSLLTVRLRPVDVVGRRGLDPAFIDIEWHQLD